MGRFAKKKKIHAFFVNNTFTSNTRLKLAKNHAKVKQHLEAEHWLIGNYSLFSSTLSSKNNRRYSLKMCDKQVRLFYEGYMINGNENEAENKI